jgi:hypothetical protein
VSGDDGARRRDIRGREPSSPLRPSERGRAGTGGPIVDPGRDRGQSIDEGLEPGTAPGQSVSPGANRPGPVGPGPATELRGDPEETDAGARSAEGAAGGAIVGTALGGPVGGVVGAAAGAAAAGAAEKADDDEAPAADRPDQHPNEG